MKSFNLLVALGLVSLIFSCTRKVNDNQSAITIQLPAIANSTSVLSQEKINILSDDGLTESDADEDTFSTIVPTGYVGGTNLYPINCYLVAVAGSDSRLKQNYCGKAQANGDILKTYEFGSFLGLKSTGENIEMLVDAGDNRKILVFGLHAINSADCADLISGKPPKSSLSKPHFLGESSLMKFEPGKSITVPVNLTNPVAANQVDDCVFPALNNRQILPIANYIGIENQSFPKDFFRKPVSAGKFCEPLDIRLKNGGQYGQPAILSSPQAATIKLNGTAIETFSDYNTCTGASSGDLSVALASGETFKRVWFQTISATPASADMTVESSGLETAAKSFLVNMTNPYKFDLIFPSKIVPGQCYKARVDYRKIDGSYFAETSSFDFSLTSNSGPSTPAVASFYSDSSCSTPVSTYTMPASQYLKEIFFSVPAANASGIQSFGVNVQQVTTPFPVNYEFTGVSIATEAATTSFAAQMRFNFKNYFKTGICIPLNLEFIDQKGNSMNHPAIGNINIDAGQSLLTNVNIYANAQGDCSSGDITSSKTTPVRISLQPTKLAIKVISTAVYGERNLVINFNGGIVRNLKFFVQNPAN